MDREKVLSEESPSVQTHLGILQDVIQRMAHNSSMCKAWCITIVSALLVVLADKDITNQLYIAFIPTLLFLVLDSYYLALEKGFRSSYNNFVSKLHKDEVNSKDLYTVNPKGNIIGGTLISMTSFSILPFYLTLAVLIITVKCVFNTL
ncbi:MAG: hypothetical protein CMP47_02890 [Rickettsiales bacterium]|nr:hypothetical protein [Rickettsiales bacterium]